MYYGIAQQLKTHGVCEKLQNFGEMIEEFISFVDTMRKKLDKDVSVAMAVVTRYL
jgi:hypothetical protein